MWDSVKKIVFGNNKFYSALTTRRVAEFLLFTANTPEEIERAYGNTLASINKDYRDDFYNLEELEDIKRRIRPGDQARIKCDKQNDKKL